MDMIWPVEKIKLAKPIPALADRVKALIDSDQVFCLDYLANDCRSGYIFLESPDGQNRGLARKLKRFGLEDLIPYIHSGQLLLMW
jgi:hypothetical protein